MLLKPTQLYAELADVGFDQDEIKSALDRYAMQMAYTRIDSSADLPTIDFPIDVNGNKRHVYLDEVASSYRTIRAFALRTTSGEIFIGSVSASGNINVRQAIFSFAPQVKEDEWDDYESIGFIGGDEIEV